MTPSRGGCTPVLYVTYAKPFCKTSCLTQIFRALVFLVPYSVVGHYPWYLKGYLNFTLSAHLVWDRGQNADVLLNKTAWGSLLLWCLNFFCSLNTVSKRWKTDFSAPILKENGWKMPRTLHVILCIQQMPEQHLHQVKIKQTVNVDSFIVFLFVLSN